MIVLPKDDRTDFAQEEQLGLPMVWAICASVHVSKCLDILTLEFSITSVHLPFLAWVWADAASASGPAHPGRLKIMSMTFAAVICDAADPCSVNNAYDPEWSFTVSPRSTTLPWYFWYWGSNSKFLRWQMSINDAKWTFLPWFLASSITFFFCFWLSSAAMPVSFPIFPFLFHCSRRIQNFWCLRHRNKLTGCSA